MENKIGFIGLGNMGANMAKNLIKAGYQLQVYNRTQSKIDELGNGSVTKCKTPAEAADGVPVVITMLSEDSILTEAVAGNDGLLKTLKKGGLHIGMSTVSPDMKMRVAFTWPHRFSADQRPQLLRNCGFAPRVITTLKKLRRLF
jgi:3-hydroxyisobutyrate dehydrogenase-like beta-hydroxyacid dehydrogenase